MAMEIVTGSTGKAHVTPIDDAVRNTNCGHYNDCVVFDVLDQLDAEITTNNLVTVKSGYGMIQGRYFKIMRGETGLAQIDVTRPDTKRMDIISARYTFNPQSTYEDISLVVLKGTAGNDYEAPETISSETHNVNEGDNQVDFPLYKVYVDATNGSSKIDHIEKLFTPLPDGGRLGEIENAFQNVLDEFEEVQNTVNNLPSDISQAASKQYVDNAVSTKANMKHRYSSKDTAMLGTNLYYGHVSLSDDYNNSQHLSEKYASSGVAASIGAVQDAYNDLKASFTAGCNAIETALINKGVTPTKAANTQNYTPTDFCNAVENIKRKVHYKVTATSTATGSAGASGMQNYNWSVTVKIGNTTKTFSGSGTTLKGFIGSPELAMNSANGSTWTQNV